MLKTPVYYSLKSLRLHAMARAYEEQQALPDIREYTFDDRLGMMLDREVVERSNRRQPAGSSRPDSSTAQPVWRTLIIAVIVV